MSAAAINKHKTDNDQSAPHSFNQAAENTSVCVLVGHSIEAITSAVVLASLGHTVHLYTDKEVLTQQLQQYGFEHHLQALWQMYVQQQQIVSYALPTTASKLLEHYETSDNNNERK